MDGDNQNRKDTRLTALGEKSTVNLGHVSLDPPKSTFMEDHNSAPTGCCPLKFLHMLENDQGLLSPSTPLFHMAIWVQLLGAPAPLKIWKGKKVLKVRRIFGSFRL